MFIGSRPYDVLDTLSGWGSFMLFKILFKTKAECDYFCRMLKEHKGIYFYTYEEQNMFVLVLRDVRLEEIIIPFIKVYITFQLKHNIESIIWTVYYYEHDEEIDRITEWTEYLLVDPQFMMLRFRHETLLNYLQQQLFTQFTYLNNAKEIYYDTVTLFQLKQFHEELVEIVGFA